MRPDTLIALPLRAEYWDFTTSITESGATLNSYHKEFDFKLMLTESQGGTQIAFCREMLRFNAQVRHIKDNMGNFVLGNDDPTTFFFVGTPIAQFDVFGNIMGYKHILTKTFQDGSTT